MNERKMIGNTPMIEITYEYDGKINKIYAKLEYYNLTGSIKDRVAYYIIKNAKEKEILKPEMPIIEATSGNTGISISALGAYYRHPVYIFMPNWASRERVLLMKSFGANVILVSEKDGGFIECVKRAKKLAAEKKGFLVNQFSNRDNFLAHYKTTGYEMLKQLPQEIGGFVSGVGTGGTLMGIGTKLKEKYKNLKIVAIEPDKMPIISKGERIGNHKIEGIGDDFVPDLLDKEKIDDIILINDNDAINMSRKLAKELGLGVGISSGANFLGCVLLSKKIDNGVVTVFADDNKKYLSTELVNGIEDNDNYISNHVKLLSYKEV